MTKTSFFVLITFLFYQCSNKQERAADTLVEQQSLVQDTATLSMAANLYYKTEKYNEALVEYNELIGIDSLNRKYLYRKAYCLTQLDKPSEAIQYYIKSAELDFNTFDCYYSIGLNALILKDDSLAIQYFEKCLLIKPDSREVLVFLKHLKPIDISVSI